MSLDKANHDTERRPTLSRRRFIRGAAAGAALTVVRASAVRGAEANSTIDLGVVGLGGRGAWIANLFARHGGYRITAVADYFPEVAEARGEGLGVEKARRFSGLAAYKRMIDAKVDAVALETPPYFFPGHAAAAVEAGCHVYMAKPVAVDAPGCLAIGEAGRKAGERKRCFLVDFQTRTDPFFQEAVKRVHEGALGHVALLSSYYTDEAFPDPPKTARPDSRFRNLVWVNDIDLGGGYLVNAGIHAVDVALWLARQTPATAMGSARIGRADPHGDSCDAYSVTYEFPDGLILNHRGEHLHNLHGFTCGCVAYGRGAYMEGNYAGKAWLRGGPKGYRGGDVENLYEAGAVRNIAAFHQNVTQGDFANPTVASSVNSTLATILGRDACRHNTKLTWDEMMKTNRRIDVDLIGLVQ